MHINLDTITTISIHVPREGDDPKRPRKKHRERYFNPRPP